MKRQKAIKHHHFFFNQGEGKKPHEFKAAFCVILEIRPWHIDHALIIVNSLKETEEKTICRGSLGSIFYMLFLQDEEQQLKGCHISSAVP